MLPYSTHSTLLHGQKLCLLGYAFGSPAAKVVNPLHHFRIMADTRDFKRLFGRDQDRRFLGNTFIDVFKRFVVPHIAGLECLVNRRISAQKMYGRTSAPAVTPIAIDLTRSSLIHPMTVKLARVFRKLSLSVPKKLVM